MKNYNIRMVWPGLCCTVVGFFAVFITSSQHLYGQEVLGTHDAERNQVVPSEVWELKFERITKETAVGTEESVTNTEQVSLLLSKRGYVLVEPETSRLYHSPTRRAVIRFREEQEYVDIPVHAQVWFAASELLNRKALCDGLAAAGLDKTDAPNGIGKLHSVSKTEVTQRTA